MQSLGLEDIPCGADLGCGVLPDLSLHQDSDYEK